MISWSWNYREPDKFEHVKPGEYRVRIFNAVETKSRKGDPQIFLTLEVAVDKKVSLVGHRLTFLSANPELTNKNLHDIYTSFGIAPGDFELNNWIGKTGAAQIEDNLYQGELRSQVKIFLYPAAQKFLPAFDWSKIKSNPESNKIISPRDINEPFANVNADVAPDLPF